MNRYKVILKSGKEVIIIADDCKVYRNQITGEMTSICFENSDNLIYLSFEEIGCITKIT